jgi:ATP-binding cassette, subfamily C, type I secretion system permease/ATPase
MPPEVEGRRGGVLREAWTSCRPALVATVAFSFCVNLLVLAGPLYMLQIYDRVLASGSVPTLVALSAILGVLFTAMGILEAVRGRLMNRVAGRLNGALGPPVLDAVLSEDAAQRTQTHGALRDLATLRQFLSSPAPIACFDVPWVPIYLAVVFIMHWVLGAVTLAGAVVMLLFAVATDRSSRRQMGAASDVANFGQRMVTEAGRSLEAILAMGMKRSLARRWLRTHDLSEFAQRNAADRIGAFSAATSTLRLVLQSALLGIGAYLAIENQISPGMMIATSIIAGRALAPIGQTVAHWRSFQGAVEAHARLGRCLERPDATVGQMPLPRPAGRLSVSGLVAAPPGMAKPVLKGVDFALEPGEALGIIGPSAAGKSTLARVLVGLWPPKGGTVRLDGSDVAIWNRDQLGPWLGYLPQDVELLEGTVHDNIGRFAADADPKAIVEAARLVGVHDLILRLPNGYDTKIGPGGRTLSAGQRQLIALARAAYQRPALIVLDEPNSNLDSEGDAALTAAIRRLKAGGTTVIVIAHRPSAIAAVDKVLVLMDGTVRAFGPKGEVLRGPRGAGPTIWGPVANDAMRRFHARA